MQYAIVILLVVAGAIYVAWSMYRRLAGKGPCAGCGMKGACDRRHASPGNEQRGADQ
jgi:hypothetical protein